MFVKLSHVQNLLCCSTLVVFAAYATSTYSHQSSVHISHYVFKKREFVDSSWFCPYLLPLFLTQFSGENASFLRCMDVGTCSGNEEPRQKLLSVLQGRW